MKEKIEKIESDIETLRNEIVNLQNQRITTGNKHSLKLRDIFPNKGYQEIAKDIFEYMKSNFTNYLKKGGYNEVQSYLLLKETATIEDIEKAFSSNHGENKTIEYFARDL